MSLIKLMSGWLTGTGAPQGDTSLATLSSCACFEGSRADFMAITSLSTAETLPVIKKGKSLCLWGSGSAQGGGDATGGPERRPCTEHRAEPASIPAPGMHLERDEL